MATMQVDVVSAETSLFSGEATGVFARTPEGEIGILPGHIPALLALGQTPVRVKLGETDEMVIAVHQGFLEFAENQLTILADSAEIVADIDTARAEAAQRRAERLLESDPSHEGARADLERAKLRLRLVEQYRTG